MDTRVATSSSIGATTSTATTHGALFTADDLLGALEAYEDLPLDLILDGATEYTVSPLDSSPLLSSSPNSSNTSDSALPSRVDDSTSHVPRSQKLRAERAFLQDQIAQLERELTSVKEAKQFATTPVLWRDVATRQRARRSRAEAENERLRAKLLRQIQVAKSLQVVLHNRALHEQQTAEPIKSHRAEDDAWMDDLGLVLRQFAVDVEHAYGAVDTVVPLNGSAALSIDDPPRNGSVVRSHVDVDGVEQLYVETTQAYIVPFRYDQVKSVAWRAFTTHFERQQRQLELYCRTDDLFACKFAGNARHDSRDRQDHGRSSAATVIARSYRRSGGCSVIVWRGFIAPINSTLREAVAVTTGWIMFRPFEGNANCAVAHVCIRTVPKCSTVFSLANLSLVRLPTAENAGDVGAFTSQKLCTTAEDIMAVMEEVENLLVDGTCMATALK